MKKETNALQVIAGAARCPLPGIQPTYGAVPYEEAEHE